MTTNTLPASDGQAIATIIEYWFAGTDDYDFKDQHKLWYGGAAEVDGQIKQQFGPYVEAAMAGQLVTWTETALGALALVILLDQFTRNIYRGSAQAFAGDECARKVLYAALEQGVDRQLSIVQRSFFYMPLEHSELLADQDRCVALFQLLLDEVPSQGKKVIANSLDFAIKHRDIIARFGRFPHRNLAMGRTSTALEQAFLKDGGARFGQ